MDAARIEDGVVFLLPKEYACAAVTQRSDREVGVVRYRQRYADVGAAGDDDVQRALLARRQRRAVLREPQQLVQGKRVRVAHRRPERSQTTC